MTGIDQCQYTTKHNCGTSEGIWLSCQSVSCDPPSYLSPSRPPPPPPPVPTVTTVQLRSPLNGQPALVNQPRVDGLLFVTLGDGTTGYVCDDYFDQNDNAVSMAAESGSNASCMHLWGQQPNAMC